MLKEKKEEGKAARPVPKKPSQIVQGYDPNASFADILYNWEHSGEPYTMPKKGSAQTSPTSFGDILAKWEGKGQDAGRKSAYKRASAPYRPKNSFADILDSYEKGTPAPKADTAPKEEDVSEEPVLAPVEARMEEKGTVSLFKAMEEDDEIPSGVAWSVFSGAQEIERPAKDEEESVVKEEVKEASPSPKPAYKATRSFASILSEYEGGIAERPQPPVEAKAKEEPAPPAVSLFKEMEEGDEIPSGVAWSVFSGARNVERRPSPVVVEPEKPAPVHRHSVKPSYSPSFHEEVEAQKEKSFDEIIQEKGDLEVLRKDKSLNELRLMLPQATLDLHGMKQAEATGALESFVEDALDAGIEKVAIIHGKGLHSQDGEGVLKDLTDAVLSRLGVVREAKLAKPAYGGSGVTWVILKKKSDL